MTNNCNIEVIGAGNYSSVIKLVFEQKDTAVKCIKSYCDRISPPITNEKLERVSIEEQRDVETEIFMLTTPRLKDLPWQWRPRFFASLEITDLCRDDGDSICEAIGFTPVKMLFMEQLECTFVDLIMRNMSQKADLIFRLFCDIFEILTHFHRNGIRHNDLMLRNVMVRRKTTKGSQHRLLTLKTKPMCRFEWQSDCEYEIVFIDFGLVSIDESEINHPLVANHDFRDALYCKRANGASLKRGIHPLELKKSPYSRVMIDLQCLAFNIQNLSLNSKCCYKLKNWAKQVFSTISNAQKQADLQKRIVDFERVIGAILPPVANKFIVNE